MFDLEKRLKETRKLAVLCIGDLMLDDFVYGEVSRISPEAPAPVIAVQREEIVIGGAGNVARNIAALGAKCVFVGIVGNDEAGAICRASFKKYKNGIVPHLVSDPSRPTTRKLRFVSEHFSTHLLRADWEEARPATGKVEKAIIDQAYKLLPRVDAVVLSDYAKGVLTPDIVRHAIDAARAAQIPVIVDPKQRSFAAYRGATVITPNLHELEIAARVAPFDVERAAASVLAELPGTALLVTRSAEGMTLFRSGRDPFHVAALAKEVFDVTGAGDTVVAALALALAAQVAFEDAVTLASLAAAISVSKRGTSTVSPAELAAAIDAAIAAAG